MRHHIHHPKLVSVLSLIAAIIVLLGQNQLTVASAANHSQIKMGQPLANPFQEVDHYMYKEATPIAPAGFVEASADRIRVRENPIDGRVLGFVNFDDVVVILEPMDVAQSKIGVENEWIHIRTSNNIEGYTAAWFYTLHEGEVPDWASELQIQHGYSDVKAMQGTSQTVLVSASTGTPTPFQTAPHQETEANHQETPPIGATLLLEADVDRIRVRATPVDGEVVGFVDLNDIVVIIEDAETAESKIGIQDKWIKVRTAEDVEGYTAAWLYSLYEGEAPVWAGELELVTATATNTVTAETDNTIAPLTTEERASLLADSVVLPSIDVLNLVSGSNDNVPNSIPPLNASIIDLNLNPSDLLLNGTDENANENAATEGEPETAIAASITTPTQTEAPATIVEDITSTSVPITIDVLDNDTTIESAILSINDYILTTFYEEPFEYNLNTQMLRPGPYELTFTTTNEEGVVSTGSLMFEVVTTTLNEIEPEVEVIVPTGAAAANTVAGVETASADPSGLLDLTDETVADSPLVKVLLIDGERVPFNLGFGTDTGLKPMESQQAVVEVVEADTDLSNILGRIPHNLIPEPVMKELTAEREQLASIVILIMVAMLVPQGLFTLYWMLYTWNNPELAEKYKSPREFYEPKYSFTAILPARREEDVIRQTIMSIDAVDYPDELKEILIMIRDEDDDETIARAQATINELGKDNIKLITFTEGPKNKPNGLNRGLKVATKDVICIFDAEDDPHPDIYNIVNTVMIRDEADVVQSGVQLMNFQSSWFSVFNVLEYFFWFKSGLHCFTHAMGVTPLGGNTVFFKRHWLEQIGGWDEGCLTEDGDIGIRLTQLGAKIQIVYDAQHATQEETPDTVESFIKQRTRWMQGFYQIFFKMEWRTLPSLKQKITAIYILLNSLLQASIAIYLPIGIYIALTQRVPVTIAMISYLPILLLFLQLITSLIGIREFAQEYNKKLPMFFSLRMILYYYPYQLMLTASAMRAVYRFLIGTQAWEKTSHSNLHRQAAATAATQRGA